MPPKDQTQPEPPKTVDATKSPEAPAAPIAKDQPPAPVEQPKISDAQERLLQSAAAQKNNDKPGRIFKTVNGHFGPYRHTPARVGNGTEANPQFPARPTVFSEADFKRKHPIPDTKAALATIDAETYHNDLLDRGIQLGAIEAAPGLIPTDTPVQAASLKNPGIKESTQSTLEHRKSVARQRAADAQRLAEAQAK